MLIYSIYFLIRFRPNNQQKKTVYSAVTDNDLKEIILDLDSVTVKRKNIDHFESSHESLLC